MKEKEANFLVIPSRGLFFYGICGWKLVKTYMNIYFHNDNSSIEKE